MVAVCRERNFAFELLSMFVSSAYCDNGNYPNSCRRNTEGYCNDLICSHHSDTKLTDVEKDFVYPLEIEAWLRLSWTA
ncbi:hypothetical protein B0J14DRAFT_599220 [Halenospora varia]|nr:hypothetical protein B0J14DRAFT_599220 [Halenospora varia]